MGTDSTSLYPLILIQLVKIYGNRVFLVVVIWFCYRKYYRDNNILDFYFLLFIILES